MAEQQQPNLLITSNRADASGSRAASMSQFRAVGRSQQEALTTSINMPDYTDCPIGDPVYVYTMSGPAQVIGLMNTVSYLLHPPEGVEPLTREEIAGVATSILVSIFTAVSQDLIRILKFNAINIVEKPIVEYMNELGLDGTGEYRTLADCIVAFAQVFLALFKNISTQSFARFFSQRTKAIRAKVGLSAEITSLVCIININQAAAIKEVLGSINDYRKVILETAMDVIVRTPGSRLGSVCQYICGIVYWTDMTPLVFIYENLAVPRSPVLRHISVQAEVVNAYYAFEAVTKFRYPQYFRILAPAMDQNLLLRSNFPTLIAVAQKIRGIQFASVNQFVSTIQGIDANLVSDLVQLHVSGRVVRISPIIRTALRFIEGEEPAAEGQQVTQPE